MIILKCYTSTMASDIAKFVNINHIKREDIVAITAMQAGPGLDNTVYYYADSDAKELTHGVFGWS